MEPLARDLARFLRLLRSFQCQKVPCDLLIRACESRPTWSSTGEIIDRLPLEAGVSKWLVDFYHSNKVLFHGTELRGYRGCIKYTMGIDGVAYLEMTSEGQHDLEVVDERDLALERIAIILQAFPSINAEIIGEEIIDGLMDVVESSILPLLLSLTKADIEAWLLPKAPEERESRLVSMVEFLYQVIDRLGIESPLIPLPMLRQLSNVITGQTVDNISIVLSTMSQVLDAYSGNNKSQSSFLPPGARTDGRSHALIGYILSISLSYGESMNQPKAPTEPLAEALSDWVPLSMSKSSTMEYLAATSFRNRMQINIIGKPSFATVDSIALQGLLLSRRKQHKDATEFLTSTIGVITSEYGPYSMQLGIVTAELANCYNILRQEEKAESCVRTTLHGREGQCVSTRRDGIYLRLALADSLIGRARYNEVVPVLEGIMGSRDISATYRMMSLLRLARSRRRMHEDPQRAFEHNSPLWRGLALLNHVPDVLTTEYIEELACNISEIPKMQRGNSIKARELIEAVNSVILRSSLHTDSPCWEWYIEVQQEYLKGVKRPAKAKKENQRQDGSQIDDQSGMGTSAVNGQDQDENHDGPWSERLVLSFDGGGVRAISSLLIVQRLMHQIMALELTHPDGSAYSSRDSVWRSRDESGALDVPEGLDRVDEFLPCHYFDYVAGTSTGGLNSIMLGRLRMSVDQAIDSFTDFGNNVFGHPQLFHVTSAYFGSRAKYSTARAVETFNSIISSGPCASHQRFPELRNGTRTMALSYCDEQGFEGCKVWRSYYDPKLPTRLANISEVMMATSATPGYFKPPFVNGTRDLLDEWIANNPSYFALMEVLSIHQKTPVVFLNIGTGSQYGSPVIHRNEGQWRDLPWRDRLRFQQVNSLLYTDSKTQKWLDISKQLGVENAHRLSVGVDLEAIPYDDWRPASTGEKTLKNITDLTEDYLRNDRIRVAINSIAHEAVRIRRARATTMRWKHFTSDTGFSSD